MQDEAMLVEKSILLIVGAAGSLLSGLVSGLVVVWLKDHVYWRKQRRMEYRSKVFDEASAALGRVRCEISLAKIAKEVRLPKEETVEQVYTANMRVGSAYTTKVSREFDKAVEMGILAMMGQEETKAYVAQDTKALTYMAVELGVKPGLEFIKWRAKWYGRWRRLQGQLRSGC